MAFVNGVVVVLLLPLLLLPQRPSATIDFLSPLLSPVFDDICKDAECGKGTCKPSKNSTFLFECECNPGWKQTRFADDDFFKFLPCIVPNCTINHSCSIAPPPAQEKPKPVNASSIFDPCHWVDCGGGSCNKNKTSMFSYTCDCEASYYNLLNVTAFPCFKECSIGMDCTNLGISLTNSSSTAAPPPALNDNSNNEAAQPPALNDNSNNEGSSILQGSFNWLVMLITSLVMIQLK